MNTFRYLPFVAVVAFAASCSRATESPSEIVQGWKSVPYVRNVNNDKERRGLELCDLIFRNEIASPIRDEIVFISFGYADDGNWIEPPDGFIDRLSDLTVIVRSVSDANLSLNGLTSKSDHRVGHVYYVQFVEWLDDNTIKINHGLYGGPLYGGGVDGAVYQFGDGKWKLKTDGQHYVS